MFDYPYIFWQVFLGCLTPAIAAAAAFAFMRLSGSREPVWLGVPLYVGVHLFGFYVSVCCGLDYDWLWYRTYNSLLWKAVYFGMPVAWLLGFGCVLWAGIVWADRRTLRRGFPVSGRLHERP